MNDISVIILTFNEEKNIARALLSVKNLTKDVVIVDSGSTDKTIEIAKSLNARVFSRSLESFAKQRNFANTHTKNDWVLSMDADEEIPDTLVDEIKNTIKNTDYSAFLVPRRNIIFNKEIKHTRWSPDEHIWIYRKNKGSWSGSVHEEWIPQGTIGKLKNAKIHYSHQTVFEFIEMLNRYTDIEAQTLHKKGIHFNFFLSLYYALRSFIGRFILKQGYLDGLEGFVLSVLMFFYRFTTWIKLWEIEKHE